jgi:hypothetical protein
MRTMGEVGVFGWVVIALAVLFVAGIWLAVAVTQWRIIYNMPSQWLGRPTRAKRDDDEHKSKA